MGQPDPRLTNRRGSAHSCGMPVKTGLHVGMLVTLMGVVGCYPKPPGPCAPNDTSCLPCSDFNSTNPTCPSWPSDTKKPDAGQGADR